MNIFISLLVLIVAVAVQWEFFSETHRKRKEFREIFPEDPDNCLKVEKDENGNSSVRMVKTVVNDGVETEQEVKGSPVFNNILASVNKYLEKNHGAADYAILKDIADRHCDAEEQQIEATAPFPIYVGLCGTLIGIVLGVLPLAFGEGLTALVDSEKATEEGLSSIKNLLGSVGVAMSTTFFGVVLSIIGSRFFKDAIEENERRKNAFLSWIQAELLPQMNSSMAKALFDMTNNLNSFNEGFRANSERLNEVFGNIHLSYEGQADFLRSLEKLDIKSIANANVAVWKELQGSSEQIGDLQKFLYKSNKYLAAVEELNRQLGEADERTKMFVNVGEYFMAERNQLTTRQEALDKGIAGIDSAMSKGVADLDKSLIDSFEQLRSSLSRQYDSLVNSLADKQADYVKAIEDQKQSLQRKLSETEQIVEELHKVADVKSAVEQLIKMTEKQNEQLTALISNISKGAATNQTLDKLANALTGLNIPEVSVTEKEEKRETVMDKIMKYSVPVTCAVVVVCCILYVCKSILNVW